MGRALIDLAIILAGGRSRRFGRDKARVEVGGEAVLDRVLGAVSGVARRLVVVGGDQPLPDDVTRFADAEPGGGPVQAIATAARAVPGHDALVLSCDLPLVEPALLLALCAPLEAASDARVPMVDDHLQPLCAFYRARGLERFVAAAGRDVRAVRAVLDELELEVVPDGWLRPRGTRARAAADFDTPGELERLLDGSKGSGTLSPQGTTKRDPK